MTETKNLEIQLLGKADDLLKEKGIKNNNRVRPGNHKAPIVTLGWLRGKIPAYPDDWRLLCKFFNVSAAFCSLEKRKCLKIGFDK